MDCIAGDFIQVLLKYTAMNALNASSFKVCFRSFFLMNACCHGRCGICLRLSLGSTYWAMLFSPFILVLGQLATVRQLSPQSDLFGFWICLTRSTLESAGCCCFQSFCKAQVWVRLGRRSSIFCCDE